MSYFVMWPGLPNPLIILTMSLCKLSVSGCNKYMTKIEFLCGKNRIFVNESLTQKNKDLFNECLKFKKDKGFRFLWAYAGTIFMRWNENSRVIHVTDASILLLIDKWMHALFDLAYFVCVLQLSCRTLINEYMLAK
jgi:hypothetical protein